MSSTLQQVVDALFAFIERGRRPFVRLLLEDINKGIDDAALPALADFLQAVGLSWVVSGPGSGNGGPSPATPNPARVIQVVNQSTVVPADEFTAAVAACQRQVLEDFAPLWGGLSCQLLPSSASPSSPHTPTVETIFVLDDSDQADALGYHELTQADVPVGFVFAHTSEQDDSPWSVTLSHELLEQLADPYVSSTAIVSNFMGTPAALAYEVCDPVEVDLYRLDDVAVSNFVLPEWFADIGKVKIRADFMTLLTVAGGMTPGGYIAFTRDLKSWQQYQASKPRAARQPTLPYSRRWKRFWRGKGANALAHLAGGLGGLGRELEKHGIATDTLKELVAQEGPAVVGVVSRVLADLHRR